MESDLQPTPKGMMLTSTACIFIVLAFLAGLLGGTLLGSARSGSAGQAASRQSAPAAPALADPAHELAEHVAQVQAEIERNPNEPLNWIHLGNLYYDENPAEAVIAYEKSLQLSPGNADVMTDLGTMYRVTGNPAKAVAQYDSVIALNPDHQNAYFNKGVTLMFDLARPADAVAAWQALLDRKPDAALGDGTLLADVLPFLATNGGNSFEAQGNMQAALEAYDLALQGDRQFQPALAHKAALLEKWGRKDEAAPVWKALLDLNPQAVTPDGTPVKDLVQP